jgi:hypothetical protein
MDFKRINILFSLSVFLCLTFFGCGQSNLLSRWRDREINVDGKYTDWVETTTYYDEKSKTVLNLMNDADYLYICLISRNRAIETKIMESGLIVWFDPDAGQKKVFGIRFPIGLKRMGISIEGEEKRDTSRDWQDQEDRSGLIDREKARLMDRNFNKRLEALEGLQERLEIIRPGVDLKGKNEPHRPPAAGVDKRVGRRDKVIAPGAIRDNMPFGLSLGEAGKVGIEAKVGRENDYFVYELKVPLMKSTEHIYAIEAKKGKPIGLGLEVDNFFSADMFGNAMSDRMPPGEGRVFKDKDTMFGSADKLKLWFTVVLSSKVSG